MMNRISSTGAAVRRRRFRTHLADPLYRTSYLLILGSGITALLGFVFWIVAARSYSAPEVGLNAAAISAMMFISGVCQLGLPPVLIRYVPRAGEGTRRLVIRAYALTGALSLGLGAGAALTSPLWSPSLGFLQRQAGWVVGFGLATAAWTVFTLQDGVLTGLRAAFWVPIENSLFSATKLVLLVVLAGVAPFSGLFLAWNIPAGIAVLGITVLVFGRLIPRRRLDGRGDEIQRPRLIRLATGNYLAQLFGIAAIFVMPVIVADVTNPATAAYFYAPWTIASAMQLVAANTASSLTLEAALDQEHLAALCRRALAHTMRLLIPASAVVVLVAPFLLAAYGPRYAHAGTTLLRLLALGALPNAVVAVGLAAARVQQNGATVLAIQAAECVPLLCLSVVLLPSAGLEGIGIAYLASQTAVAIWLIRSTPRSLLGQRAGAIAA